MWLVIEREEVRVTLSRDTCSCQNGVHAVCKKPKNRRTGVRVLVVAEIRGSARGAKGHRKAKVEEAKYRESEATSDSEGNNTFSTSWRGTAHKGLRQTLCLDESNARAACQKQADNQMVSSLG